MKLYLAGDVPKGDDIGQSVDWRAPLIALIQTVEPNAQMLSPINPDLDANDPLAAFGFCCAYIQDADAVIIQADKKLGVGTAQEMVIAKHFAKPVLTILPPDTHHRRTNLQQHKFLIADYRHPFIVAMSDYIFDSAEDLKSFIGNNGLKRAATAPKTLQIITDAIDHYRKVYPRSY